MPDKISGMGKTHGNASLLCKKEATLKYHQQKVKNVCEPETTRLDCR
jgi:hypothetical protein